jgi:hypothetical protein
MKTRTIQSLLKGLGAFLFSILLALKAGAQDKVQVNEQTISAWFSRNWMWVAAGVIILILIAFFGKGSSTRRKTTTIVKDDVGNVRSVTTTEVKE